MAMNFFLSTSFSASLLPILRKPATVPSVSFSLKPRRYLSLSRIPPNPPRLSRIPTSSSCKPPTAGVIPSVATASRTLLFLLVASLLSLSGVRPRPALASAPTPTQQPQEIEGQDEHQESEECKQQGEDDVKKSEEEVKDEEREEALMQQGNEEEEEEKGEEDVEADEEVKMYLAILSRNPGDVDALKCVLYAKMRRANWDGALRYARRLREAEPGEVEWRLMEAQLHELRGDLAEAERQFREVLAEDPLLIRALHGLALSMDKRPEASSAIEMLENALQLAVSEKRVPEERNIKLLIAQMHVVKSEFDIASEKLQNLINEDPRDFRPHLCQGIVYALLDKKDEANVQFDIYRSLVPDEFPDKSFINDIILAAKTESNDRVKEFGSEFVWEK
ncbi:hypothetical protein QOZ80_5AG0402560 [Eleusine coracana subsp. coracana]|nr:hypothetical protein QOZ80_5AG0402560 [Eleusine coracana subsp. coracana]